MKLVYQPWTTHGTWDRASLYEREINSSLLKMLPEFFVMWSWTNIWYKWCSLKIHHCISLIEEAPNNPALQMCSRWFWYRWCWWFKVWNVGTTVPPTFPLPSYLFHQVSHKYKCPLSTNTFSVASKLYQENYSYQEQEYNGWKTVIYVIINRSIHFQKTIL